MIINQYSQILMSFLDKSHFNWWRHNKIL